MCSDRETTRAVPNVSRARQALAVEAKEAIPGEHACKIRGRPRTHASNHERAAIRRAGGSIEGEAQMSTAG